MSFILSIIDRAITGQVIINQYYYEFNYQKYVSEHLLKIFLYLASCFSH